MSFLYRVIRIIVIPFVYLFFRIRVHGKENIPKENGLVLCCNHTSMWDIVFLGVTFNRQICFMGKKEIFKIPVIKGLFKMLGAFPVDRKSSDKGAVNKAMEICKSGKVLGIFPEGTRNREGGPKKAKAGAAMIAIQTEAQILPVCIYRSKARVLPFQKVTVRYGKPIGYEDCAQKEEGKISKNQIRTVSEQIMDNITKLWEKKH